MSLTPKSPFFLLLALLVLPLMETQTTTLSSSSSSSSSLMEVLHSHGLPTGLFPENVKSFNFDHQTGSMEVHMDSPCLAQYETQVFFDTVVKTKLSFGQLKIFEGMSRKELFLWFAVKYIRVTDPSSGLIVIDIGLAFKRLSSSWFDNPPICISQSHHGPLSLRMSARNMGNGFRDQR